MGKTIFITGSLGLIGYTSTRFFLSQGNQVVGIDNDLRSQIFDIPSQNNKKRSLLKKDFGDKYIHYSDSIENKHTIDEIYKEYGSDISLVIHTAAQTSHDWAKQNAFLDFSVNATGTLNLLEGYRIHAPHAVFIFTSTNKVYGDRVNRLPFVEEPTRFDLTKDHNHYDGIDEEFSIDQSTHSLFGVSKTSADLLVQEYGRYFGLKTGVFRLGVVTGSAQSGSFYQGYISYLIEIAKARKPFSIIGYHGKQVRDIIHAEDVARAFEAFYRSPQSGAVFNLGGGRKNAYSLRELITMIETEHQLSIKTTYLPTPRIGDHQWWITNTQKFQATYPEWSLTFSVNDIVRDVFNNQS